MPEDIIAYRNAQAAAETAQEEAQQWDEWMPAPQHPYYPPGYRLTTNLGQKPKLGGGRVLTDITFMFTHIILFVGVHTFSLYHP